MGDGEMCSFFEGAQEMEQSPRESEMQAAAKVLRRPTQPCNFPGTIAAKRGSARSLVPRAAAPGRSQMERRESIAIASARERESSMAMRLGNGRRMKTTLQASKLATCRRTSTSTSSAKESVAPPAHGIIGRTAHTKRHARARSCINHDFDGNLQPCSVRSNRGVDIQRSAKRRGCLLSYSQAEPGRKLTQPSPRLLAEPCSSGIH